MAIMARLEVIMLLILLLPNGCAAGNHSFRIDETGAGEWKLGMKYTLASKMSPEFRYLLREGIDEEEGFRYRIVSVWKRKDKNTLVATFNLSEDNEITVITIFDPRFVTREGISVGSTIEDLVSAYPAHKIISRGQPILVPEGKKMEFFLSASFPKKLWGKISGIRIGVE
ncbi:MAG: hypothetical protein D6732_08940 [Methanobacteriota archaeon]|nr:MAG: hypothetical protein D6732_08940 [Euryarchaeota archaeon]